MKRHLVIGFGQVGRAVWRVLREKYEADAYDAFIKTDIPVSGKYDVLHICFPYSDSFVTDVLKYQNQYLVQGGLTIIHSTVPIGTSQKCDAVHSPVRGTHPNLYEGIKTFVKYFGGARAEEAAQIFSALGITTLTTPKAENTEALKLLDTAYYGWNIVFEKEVKKLCDAKGLDFDLVYTKANEDYNAGYALLGRLDVIRPVLKHIEGKIGGHCVIPNCDLLPCEITKIIKSKNQTY